jgi:Ala-tRNA(Pro) deacylase
MRMPHRVEELLNARHIAYHTLPHREEQTSQEVAHASHVPGRKLAKVVALRGARGAWMLAVVPAPLRVDLSSLRFWTGQKGLRLATEAEIMRRFPDCEPGAVPPIAPLHDVPVFIDDSFADTPDVYFEDGSRRRLVGLRLKDFIRIANPTIRHFSTRRAH